VKVPLDDAVVDDVCVEIGQFPIVWATSSTINTVIWRR
jgi:hypothetical protein